MKTLKTQIFWPQLYNSDPKKWIQEFLVKIQNEWRELAIAFNTHHDGITSMGFVGQPAAPSSPIAGTIILADRTNWDPLAKGSGGAYFVWWNGSAWKAIDSQ